MPFAEIGRRAGVLHMVADDALRRQVANDLDLEAVKQLSADLVVRAWRDGAEIRGAVRAVVTRICGVSLEPFDETIDEPLKVIVVPQGSPNLPVGAGPGLDLDSQVDDPPEEAQGAAIELGAYVIEHLALALAPFPRKPGAVFTPPPPSLAQSPFAALSSVKRTPSDT